jgi:hypothetical protein
MRVTAEDIGRTNPPMEAFQVACGECFNRIRSISQLIPDRNMQGMMLDFSWMVPTFSLALFSVAVGVSQVGVQGFYGVRAVSQFLGVATVLFGLVLTWDRTKYRYGFTHDLRWSLSSKRVDLALAIVAAGIIVATLSGLLLR